MKTSTINGRDVILTAGMIDGASGCQIFGLFANEVDARSGDPDSIAIGTVGRESLTDEQAADAEHNSALLAATPDVVETLPSGREIRRTASGFEVQPPTDNYWIDCPTIEEARRVALCVVDVCDMIDMLQRAKASGGAVPETGATVGQICQVLADMADGLLDVSGSEIAKAAVVCRREGVKAG